MSYQDTFSEAIMVLQDLSLKKHHGSGERKLFPDGQLGMGMVRSSYEDISIQITNVAIQGCADVLLSCNDGGTLDAGCCWRHYSLLLRAVYKG